jgi:hypothetical protein
VVTVVGDVVDRLAQWVGRFVWSGNGDHHVERAEQPPAPHEPERTPPMRQLTSAKLVPILVALTLSTIACAQAGPRTPLPTVEQQIAAAVLPLPKPLRDSATVMGYRTRDKLETLRQGSNGMICLALFAVQKSFHVACYQDGMEPFMARGRELRAQGVKNDQVDSVRFREVKSGKIPMPKQAMMYQLFGDEKSWDPATGQLSNVQELLVLYLPFATQQTSGIPTLPSKSGPWLMYPGTPKAHLMLNGVMP